VEHPESSWGLTSCSTLLKFFCPTGRRIWICNRLLVYPLIKGGLETLDWCYYHPLSSPHIIYSVTQTDDFTVTAIVYRIPQLPSRFPFSDMWNFLVQTLVRALFIKHTDKYSSYTICKRVIEGLSSAKCILRYTHIHTHTHTHTHTHIQVFGSNSEIPLLQLYYQLIKSFYLWKQL